MLGNIFGALRGNRFLALAVVLLLLVSVWRFTPFGAQLPVDTIIQTIKEMVPERDAAPPAEGEEEPPETGPSGPGAVSAAAEKGKELVGRAAAAGGTVLNTPTKQVGSLFRNMSVWQAIIVSGLAIFLLRRGVVTAFTSLVIGQFFDAGQAIDRRAREVPVLQWIIYFGIFLGIVHVFRQALNSGWEKVPEVAVTRVLPLLVLAWIVHILPQVRNSVQELVQAVARIFGPAFNALRWLGIAYFGGSWALAIPWGDKVSTIVGIASSQPRPMSWVVNVATVGVQLANALMVDDWIKWLGIIFFAVLAAQEVVPARRGAGG